MTTTEERMQILNMVAEGKITADEGARLLSALEPERKRETRPLTDSPSAPRWFRVRVTDLETARQLAQQQREVDRVVCREGEHGVLVLADVDGNHADPFALDKMPRPVH